MLYINVSHEHFPSLPEGRHVLRLSFRLGKNGAADTASQPFPPAAGIHINGIKPHMSTVQDPQAHSHSPAFDLHAGHNRFLWDRLKHRRNDPPECGIGSTIQAKERMDPFIRDPVTKLYDRLVRVINRRRQTGISSIVFIFRRRGAYAFSFFRSIVITSVICWISILSPPASGQRTGPSTD